MPWHPVPRRAASAYLQYRLLMTCSRLISYVFYKETALGLWGLYWLSQCGIPHRTCRFYLLLAGAPKDEEEGLCGALLPHPLDSTSSTRGIRCGGALLLPRAYSDIVSLYPVLSLLASSEFCVAICVRAGIVRVSVGLLGIFLSFFIIGGMDCLCLRLRGVLLFLS